MFDVLVVGGGPAGAVTGMCLARAGAQVAIVEATGYDGDRFGETVPPEINPVLRELGLWEPFQELAPVESPGIVSNWGTESAVELARGPRRALVSVTQRDRSSGDSVRRSLLASPGQEERRRRRPAAARAARQLPHVRARWIRRCWRG